jgi:hypothetical protein
VTLLSRLDSFTLTLNALKFKQAYKKRTDLVKDVMSGVPVGDRTAMVNAIVDAINKGGLPTLSYIGTTCPTPRG